VSASAQHDWHHECDALDGCHAVGLHLSLDLIDLLLNLGERLPSASRVVDRMQLKWVEQQDVSAFMSQGQPLSLPTVMTVTSGHPDRHLEKDGTLTARSEILAVWLCVLESASIAPPPGMNGAATIASRGRVLSSACSG
jgi:hypothetical protein